MRTVTVSTAIAYLKSVAPYEDVRKITKSKERISRSDCVCLVRHRAAGHECDQPVEVCFGFDFYADGYVAMGMGRWITHEEALSLREKRESDRNVPPERCDFMKPSEEFERRFR